MELKPALWVLKHQIRTSNGLPFEFDKRKFMWDFLNDLSPKQAMLKPPQVGASETVFVKCFWVAKKKGKDIIYTLPSLTDVQDMVGGKFNRIISQNPIMQEWTKDHDSIQQKRIGDSTLYLRGTVGSTSAMMVSSGLNAHDEVDASDPITITQYETRQEAQEREEDKWRWYFSHPSLSGHGVDVYWKKSDQKEWYIQCPSCKKDQTLSWPDNIDLQRQVYICSFCKAELPDISRINGEWRNKDGILWTGEIVGDYEFSGWHISQLMLFNKSAKSIIDAYNDPQKDKQYFYNYVLGLPYIGSDDKIEPAAVLRNCVDEVNLQTEPIVIGADTGHGIHFVCMNKDGVFFFENATEITASKTPYDRIRELLRRWPKSIAMFDQGGDLIGVRQLQQEFPGRVFLVFYQKDRKSTDMIKWGTGDDYWKVQVDRNRMITLMVEQLRDIGRIRFNGSKEEWAALAEMFGNLYREKVEVKETKGKDDRSLYGNEYVWKRNGPDHFAHALLYALVGMQRYGGGLAKILTDDFMGVPKAPFQNVVGEPEIQTWVPSSAFPD